MGLDKRVFLAGPNASGKSNLLDAFRFLRDLAISGGGLEQAVALRGGVNKIRCLAARKDPLVEIDVELKGGSDPGAEVWRYEIGLKQQSRGDRRVILTHERVSLNGALLCDRPDKDDRADELRLTETHLEQINANRSFRKLAECFQGILYLHLVPQLLKYPRLANRDAAGEDPFGIRFLDNMMRTPEKTRRSRLRKIEKALQAAVPELAELRDVRDEKGLPHLEAVYRHWRKNAGKQREDQFSDGTLRLIGLFWTLLEGDGLLLLEEPELSLHAAVVEKLPELIWRLQRSRNRQVILSSHSFELFNSAGILPEDIVLLKPHGSEGTEVLRASDKQEVADEMNSGVSVASVVRARTAPENVHQLTLLD